MDKLPKGWPRIATAVFYEDAAAAIDWLCRAFGFEVRLKVEGEGGSIEHSELTFGDGLIMVATAGAKRSRPDRAFCISPRTASGGNTQSLCVYVDDVDAHCDKAKAAGAKIVTAPATKDYGDDYWSDRSYEAEDPEGHHWWFIHRVREQGTSAG
jgi:uncharacterized glyoxalase superfamily protein PhnB